MIYSSVNRGLYNETTVKLILFFNKLWKSYTMEAFQSYFIRKRKVQDNQTVIKTLTIQCVMRAMDSILQYDDIRNRIVFQKFPKLENACCKMKTNELFDISQNQYAFTDETDKSGCDIMNDLNDIQGVIVIPIKMSDIHQYIIIDKTMMELYIIDSSDQKKQATNPCNILAKFFRHHGYHTNSVLLSNSTAIASGECNPFSHSWSLMLLMEALDQLHGPMKCIGVYHHPQTRTDHIKYTNLLDFYKSIVKNHTTLQYDLHSSFIASVNHYKKHIVTNGGQKIFEHIMDVSPVEIILSMTLDDIILAIQSNK